MTIERPRRDASRTLSSSQPILGSLEKLTDGHCHRRPAALADRARRAPRGREEGHRRRHPRYLRRGQGGRLRRQDHAPDRAAAENEARRPRRDGSDPRHLQSSARAGLSLREILSDLGRLASRPAALCFMAAFVISWLVYSWARYALAGDATGTAAPGIVDV